MLSNYIKFKYNLFKKLCQPVYPLFKFKILKPYNDWRQNVIDWFNNILDEQNRKTLFLFGPGDTAKTFFIKSLFGHLAGQTFIPCISIGQSAWKEWDPKLYNLVIIDLISLTNKESIVLKMILEKIPFSLKKKYSQKNKIVIVKCPIIVISNQDPPDFLKEIICPVKTESKPGSEKSF